MTRLRRTAVVLVAWLSLAGALGGCVSARNGLGTTSSPCYRAVPVASDAVRDKGSLAGIRLVSQKSLAKYPRLVHFLEHLTGSAKQNVCVVSFHGTYSSGDVETPLGRPRTGSVAVVIVTTPQNKLLGTVLLSRDPLPLRHLVLRTEPRSAAGTPARPLS